MFLHGVRFIWQSAIFMLHFCVFENSCRDFTNYFSRCIPQKLILKQDYYAYWLNWTLVWFCSVKKIHFALTWVTNSILCHFKTQTQINEQKHLNDQYHCEEAEWFITQDHSYFHWNHTQLICAECEHNISLDAKCLLWALYYST